MYCILVVVWWKYYWFYLFNYGFIYINNYYRSSYTSWCITVSISFLKKWYLEEFFRYTNSDFYLKTCVPCLTFAGAILTIQITKLLTQVFFILRFISFDLTFYFISRLFLSNKNILKSNKICLIFSHIH
jgi:hypothetical protein